MKLEAQIRTLKSLVRGPVIEPQDAGYDQARKVYNAMIDKHPRLIVQCADPADVIGCVRFARETGVVTAIRGGGHNGAGLGTCDDGVVIDLARMNGVRVDPVVRTVRAEAGCRQGDVDHAAHAFGLAVPAGIVSTTGIAGLTLGGGHGYLTRKYGLTIDNLLEADLVLADGRFVTASATQNEDLFWAIRGGGGNFGVVTSFLYRAHPVDKVFAGVTLWPMEQASELAEWFREVMRTASEDVYCFLAFLVVPPGPPFPEQLYNKTMVGLVWCYCGPLEKAEAALQPLRRFRKPAFEHLGPMPFPALQSLFDPQLPPGLQWYWKGDFFTELGGAAIAEHLKFGANLPSPLSLMHLYPIDGALNRVAPGDTAFNYREAKYSMVIAGVDSDPANASRITKWAKDYWAALHPYSAGGAYVNFMMEEGLERVQATYRGNFDRLATVKAKYDPNNLFRVNQNIQPGLGMGGTMNKKNNN
jgi:FAD/FMN-containing dehydrogenase